MTECNQITEETNLWKKELRCLVVWENTTHLGGEDLAAGAYSWASLLPHISMEEGKREQAGSKLSSIGLLPFPLSPTCLCSFAWFGVIEIGSLDFALTGLELAKYTRLALGRFTRFCLSGSGIKRVPPCLAMYLLNEIISVQCLSLSVTFMIFFISL